MLTVKDFKDYLFGKDAEDTSFINHVSNLFTMYLTKHDDPHQNCVELVKGVAENTWIPTLMDCNTAAFIIDCLCGPGSGMYLMARNEPKVHELQIEDFTPETLVPNYAWIDQFWGRNTGCNNKNVYLTCYRYACKIILDNLYTRMYDLGAAILAFRDGKHSTVTSKLIYNLIFSNEIKSEAVDDLAKIFSTEVFDEQAERLRYVIRNIPETERNPYKVLVIKYLDIIEEQEMREAGLVTH